MIHNKAVPSLLSLLLLISCAPCSAKKSYHDEGPNTGAIIAGVGAAVAAVGGLIWALQPDDPETALSKAHTTYRETCVKYEEAIDKICRHGVSPRFIDEKILYPCALAGVHSHCACIYSSICALSDSIDKAEKAIKRAKSDCLKDELSMVVEKLRRLKRELSDVQECLSIHKAYFELFDLEAKLLASHARELETCRVESERVTILLPGVREGYLQTALNSCLNLRYRPHDADWKYPYFAYAQKCAHDIGNLERAIGSMSSCHQGRLNEAYKLLHALKTIHHCVATAPEYHSNIRAREQERIDRERLELERARLRAEQERARAEQERVALERERVAIENARLREERLNNMRHYCSICAHEWYAMADRCNCRCCCN